MRDDVHVGRRAARASDLGMHPQTANGQYLIHYDNYDDSWDEWVGPNRMRTQ